MLLFSVLRKRGKIISFLRNFFTTRPTRASLKRTGIVKERVFGCDLGEHLLNSGLEVPLVLKCCGEIIESHGLVDGIYRLSGVASNIQKLRLAFDENRIPDLTEEHYLQDIHSISSLIKMYFRELPNPLLTYQLYDQFSAAVQEEDNRLMKLHDVVQQLPPPHYRTAEYLMRHLARVASQGHETGMHCKNLAIVWAPNLLRSKELETSCSAAALQGVGIQAIVTEHLIRYCDLIFSDKLPNMATGNDGEGPKRPRPKSLAISTPAKLLSLEEARERALCSVSGHEPQQKYIEVGGGPSSLPDKYHTVIDLPHKKKSRKASKSPGASWKSFFSRDRRQVWKKQQHHKSRTTAVSPVRLDAKTEAALTGEELARRRKLRSVKSADSLLSTSSSVMGNRLSDLSDGTTIANPYAEEDDVSFTDSILRATSTSIDWPYPPQRSASCDYSGASELEPDGDTIMASDTIVVQATSEQGATGEGRSNTQAADQSTKLASEQGQRNNSKHIKSDSLPRMQSETWSPYMRPKPPRRSSSLKPSTSSDSWERNSEPVMQRSASEQPSSETSSTLSNGHGILRITPTGYNSLPIPVSRDDNTNALPFGSKDYEDLPPGASFSCIKSGSCPPELLDFLKSDSESPVLTALAKETEDFDKTLVAETSGSMKDEKTDTKEQRESEPAERHSSSHRPPSNVPYVGTSVDFSSGEELFPLELAESPRSNRKLISKLSEDYDEMDVSGQEGAKCELASLDGNLTDIDEVFDKSRSTSSERAVLNVSSSSSDHSKRAPPGGSMGSLNLTSGDEKLDSSRESSTDPERQNEKEDHSKLSASGGKKVQSPIAEEKSDDAIGSCDSLDIERESQEASVEWDDDDVDEEGEDTQEEHLDDDDMFVDDILVEELKTESEGHYTDSRSGSEEKSTESTSGNEDKSTESISGSEQKLAESMSSNEDRNATNTDKVPQVFSGNYIKKRDRKPVSNSTGNLAVPPRYQKKRRQMTKSTSVPSILQKVANTSPKHSVGDLSRSLETLMCDETADTTEEKSTPVSLSSSAGNIAEQNRAARVSVTDDLSPTGAGMVLIPDSMPRSSSNSSRFSMDNMLVAQMPSRSISQSPVSGESESNTSSRPSSMEIVQQFEGLSKGEERLLDAGCRRNRLQRSNEVRNSDPDMSSAEDISCVPTGDVVKPEKEEIVVDTTEPKVQSDSKGLGRTPLPENSERKCVASMDSQTSSDKTENIVSTEKPFDQPQDESQNTERTETRKRPGRGNVLRLAHSWGSQKFEEADAMATKEDTVLSAEVDIKRKTLPSTEREREVIIEEKTKDCKAANVAAASKQLPPERVKSMRKSVEEFTDSVPAVPTGVDSSAAIAKEDDNVFVNVEEQDNKSKAIDVPYVSPAKRKKKRSVKELMNQFECLSDSPPKEAQPTEVAQKPQVFQKPKVIKINSLSPTQPEKSWPMSTDGPKGKESDPVTCADSDQSDPGSKPRSDIPKPTRSDSLPTRNTKYGPNVHKFGERHSFGAATIAGHQEGSAFKTATEKPVRQNERKSAPAVTGRQGCGQVTAETGKLRSKDGFKEEQSASQNTDNVEVFERMDAVASVQVNNDNLVVNNARSARMFWERRSQSSERDSNSSYDGSVGDRHSAGHVRTDSDSSGTGRNSRISKPWTAIV